MPRSRKRKDKKTGKPVVHSDAPIEDSDFSRALLVKMATDARNKVRKQAATNAIDGGQWLPGYAELASAEMRRVNALLEKDMKDWEQ